MAKFIAMEGTDCSGKETQSKMLVDRFNKEGISTCRISFPVYDSPTGRIIGACLLGKEQMCKEWLANGTLGFFDDATLVDPLVSSAYYGADRRFHLSLLKELLADYELVVADRYTYSNMAHQGSKIDNFDDKIRFFDKIELLEFNYFELPIPDKVYFLYAPYEATKDMRSHREEKLDQAERNEEHLKKSEKTYLLLAEHYGFETIPCSYNYQMRTKEDIHEEVYQRVKKLVR